MDFEVGVACEELRMHVCNRKGGEKHDLRSLWSSSESLKRTVERTMGDGRARAIKVRDGETRKEGYPPWMMETK